jgi:branched-chain amino acid transport system ATP-binding protein
MTVLLAEQNAAMALDVASRAYVLAAGAISVEGTPEQLKASPIVEQLYFGAAAAEAAHA